MENDHHRRHPRLIQPSPSLFADSSTYPSNMGDHTGDQLARSEPWSTVYSLERPELASTLSLEPSMFIACSWEPSLLSQPANRHMTAHDRTFYPELNHYPSTPLLAQGNIPLDNMLPARRNFLGTNITLSEQPLLESGAGQLTLSRRAPDSDHNFSPASQFQAPYGLQDSPRSQTQSRESAASPLPPDYPRENKKAARLLPTSSYTSSRSQNKPLKDAYTEQFGIYDKPYAYLLYEALRSAKDYRLSLQEIYRWFEDNTSKANDPNSKGWQSSIRHNLSMNEAFVLYNESSVRGKSKNNYWTLTEEALQNGVQSTTRYRGSVSKRPLKAETVTAQRNEPGRKGGNASRFASRSRHVNHILEAEMNEQSHSNPRFGVQQPLGLEQQSGIGMHSLYRQGSSMFAVPMSTQRWTSNTVSTSSESSQIDSVRSHGPLNNPYGQDLT